MPYCEAQTEPVVAVAVAIVPVEVEHSRISTIVIVASTFEERVVRIHKISVIILQVYPRLFAQAFARTKRFLCLSFVFSVLYQPYFRLCSDNRYHITILRSTNGTRSCRCSSHRTCRSRRPLH